MPTIKQKTVFNKLGETGGVISKAMEGVYANPQKTEKLTQSNGWKELMDTYFSDEDLANKHKQLLNSSRMDHMVFPLGPKDEDDINFSGAKVKNEQEDLDEAEVPEQYKERTTLTDKEIIEMQKLLISSQKYQIDSLTRENEALKQEAITAESKLSRVKNI